MSSKHLIHPTAKIHPLAYLDPTTEITIGPNVEVGAFTVIGTRGEYKNDRPKDGRVHIEANTVIREQVTIQVSIDGNTTYIGSDCYIMNKSHIAHDVIIANNCTISTGVLIGGWCTIGENTNIGLGAAIHQRLAIGEGVMIGMNTPVSKHIPPYTTVAGSPVRILKPNLHGLNKRGEDPRLIDDLQKHYPFTIKSRENSLTNPLIEAIYGFYQEYPKALDKFIYER